MTQDQRDDLVVRLAYAVLLGGMAVTFALFLWQGPTLDGDEPWPARHPLWFGPLATLALAILARLTLVIADRRARRRLAGRPLIWRPR